MAKIDDYITQTSKDIADIEAMITDTEKQNMAETFKVKRLAELAAFKKTLEGYLKTLKEAKK